MVSSSAHVAARDEGPCERAKKGMIISTPLHDRLARPEFPLLSSHPPVSLLCRLFWLLGPWVVSKREKVIKRLAAPHLEGGGGGDLRAA